MGLFLYPRLGGESVLLVLVLAPLIASLLSFTAGLLATLLCLVSAAYFFFDPLNSLAVERAEDWLRLTVFAALGTALSAWGGARRQGLKQAREQRLHTKTLKRLHESNALKTAMISTSLDAIITIDHAGNVVEFNPAAERIFGYRREDVLGKEMAELIIPPALREGHRQGLARIMETGDGRLLNRLVELTAMGADQTEFPVELTITCIDVLQPPLFTGYIRDITSRKNAENALRESEEKFRNLADNISQLAWMADEKGDRFWFNQRWYDYSGSTLEEMRGEGWKRLHHPDHLERVVKNLEHSFSTGEPWTDIFPLRGKEGSYRWFLSHALPIRNEQGGIFRWFGTNTDITEQRELQEKLRRVAARLSEADKRKDEFLATLAHELRNPLAPIQTGLELMKRMVGASEGHEEIRAMMERQVQQLTKLVDDLLDISRITQGRLELQISRASINDIIQVAVETSKPLIDAKGHKLSVDLPEEPLHLNVDRHRLAQVVSNLLNNAAKYTLEGGHIWLSVKPLEELVAISVKDSGIGIPEDQLNSVFELFAQIDHPLEKGYTGLGIGLTLARTLVEMHGGTIEVESRGRDQGTEFTLTLPFPRGQLEGGQRQVRHAGAESPEKAGAGRKLKVLVADDNRDAAAAMATLVKMEGHDVRQAKDGQEAIEIAETFRPDLILMDLGMPRLNGYEAARHIRKQAWSARMMLIAVSGWGQEADKQRTRDAGFDDHLVKPVTLAQLRKLLPPDLAEARSS